MSDSSSPHDAGDDLSGLMGFFFYAFIIHPVVAWILRPGRFERRKSIMYAIAFLAGFAAVKTGTSGIEPAVCERRWSRAREEPP